MDLVGREEIGCCCSTALEGHSGQSSLIVAGSFAGIDCITRISSADHVSVIEGLTVEESIVAGRPNYLALQNKEIVLEEIHGMNLGSGDVAVIESTVGDQPVGLVLGCTVVSVEKQPAFDC